jgi:transcriptional regulator with XRE-family HTH domain
MTPGELVRQYRLRQNIKQLDLAIRSGVSVSTISRIENDKVKVKAEALPRLAAILNTSVESLFPFTSKHPLLTEAPSSSVSENERALYERCLRKWEQENEVLKQELKGKKLEIQQLRTENKVLREQSILNSRPL